MIGFLIDLDGTMYHGGVAIPHAPSFIQHLRERGIPFLFVTNNSSRTPKMVADHLNKLGIPAHEHEIYTSAQATAQYIIDYKLGKNVYMIGESGLEAALEEVGIQISEGINEGKEQIDAVIQGIDRAFNYQKLTKAVQLIHQGARFIITNPDHLLPSDKRPQPGAGSIAAAIQAASKKEPVVIGKPSPIIMEYAITKLMSQAPSLSRANIWVVGDNLHTDIQAGIKAGLSTALVLTGITKADDLNLSSFQPQIVVNDLFELAQKLL
ncbi:TIGR01457 family HAD-type hydrolase [Tepidibacillus decaturensis]|uniref:Acid sugar phosphatase n=1 Tax=Tepidibacillus decaturensis TaxID=1413211 RepID=A0A135L6R7_9BACI|nr:TIGR01457 family HAD-type hydrolase [Tepidibacillus decaturensis]KXG44695.1 hypothetical protein U473_12175 [Tepidibacillus decaturensis]